MAPGGASSSSRAVAKVKSESRMRAILKGLLSLFGAPSNTASIITLRTVFNNVSYPRFKRFFDDLTATSEECFGATRSIRHLGLDDSADEIFDRLCDGAVEALVDGEGCLPGAEDPLDAAKYNKAESAWFGTPVVLPKAEWERILKEHRDKNVSTRVAFMKRKDCSVRRGWIFSSDSAAARAFTFALRRPSSFANRLMERWMATLQTEKAMSRLPLNEDASKAPAPKSRGGKGAKQGKGAKAAKATDSEPTTSDDESEQDDESDSEARRRAASAARGKRAAGPASQARSRGKGGAAAAAAAAAPSHTQGSEEEEAGGQSDMTQQRVFVRERAPSPDLDGAALRAASNTTTVTRGARSQEGSQSSGYDDSKQCTEGPAAVPAGPLAAGRKRRATETSGVEGHKKRMRALLPKVESSTDMATRFASSPKPVRAPAPALPMPLPCHALLPPPPPPPPRIGGILGLPIFLSALDPSDPLSMDETSAHGSLVSSFHSTWDSEDLLSGHSGSVNEDGRLFLANVVSPRFLTTSAIQPLPLPIPNEAGPLPLQRMNSALLDEPQIQMTDNGAAGAAGVAGQIPLWSDPSLDDLPPSLVDMGRFKVDEFKVDAGFRISEDIFATWGGGAGPWDGDALQLPIHS